MTATRTLIIGTAGGEFTVSGGEIDVSAVNATLTSCEVGFGFDVELKTNPIDVNDFQPFPYIFEWNGMTCVEIL